MESWHEENSVHSFTRAVVCEERMRQGQWLESVLCVPFSALTLMVGWLEGYRAPIPIGSVLEQVVEEDPSGSCLIQVTGKTVVKCNRNDIVILFLIFNACLSTSFNSHFPGRPIEYGRPLYFHPVICSFFFFFFLT